MRYIRRCTFVRVCSLTFRQTFDGHRPARYRRAGSAETYFSTFLGVGCTQLRVQDWRPLERGLAMTRSAPPRASAPGPSKGRQAAHGTPAGTLCAKHPAGSSGKECPTRCWARLLQPGRGSRRFLRRKPLYGNHLQRPIFSFHLKRCRIKVYSEKSPLTSAVYFGGNASCKDFLNKDLRLAYPQQWLFFKPEKPRKNSEGVS